MPSLREILSAASAMTDYTREPFVSQRASVNMAQLESDIDRLGDRIMILAHAFDRMKEGCDAHPLPALLHACECLGPVSDTEFSALLQIWSSLCHGPNSGPRVIAQG